jgi:hypothetical protein
MALTLLARAFMMTMNSFVFLTKLMMIIHKYISLFAFFRWFDSQNMSGFFGTEEVKLTHRKLLGVLRGEGVPIRHWPNGPEFETLSIN